MKKEDRSILSFQVSLSQMLTLVWYLLTMVRDAVVWDLIIGKQRNGPVGTVKLTYLKPYTRFESFTAERA